MKILQRSLTTALFFCAASAFAQSGNTPQVAAVPPAATPPAAGMGAPVNQDYRLGPGDAIGVQVFQSPDLSVEARVSEGGVISYPLVGSITLGGLTISEAEKKIADALRTGGFVRAPQVNIVLKQVRGSQNRLRLHRRDVNGKVIETTPQLTDVVRPEDVIYVRESIF